MSGLPTLLTALESADPGVVRQGRTAIPRRAGGGRRSPTAVGPAGKISGERQMANVGSAAPGWLPSSPWQSRTGVYHDIQPQSGGRGPATPTRRTMPPTMRISSRSTGRRIDTCSTWPNWDRGLATSVPGQIGAGRAVRTTTICCRCGRRDEYFPFGVFAAAHKRPANRRSADCPAAPIGPAHSSPIHGSQSGQVEQSVDTTPRGSAGNSHCGRHWFGVVGVAGPSPPD